VKSEQKVVLITGAGAGIGRSLVELFLKNNFFVIALDKNISSLDSSNLNLLATRCDLSLKEERRDTFENIRSSYEVDLIVANAGVGGINPGYDFSTELNNLFFEVNYFSVVDLINTFVSQMKIRKSGHICVISSLASLRGMPQAASYSSSKSALNKTIESFRVDLINDGIKFTNIMPGFIKTKMTNHDEFSMPFMISSKRAASLIFQAIIKEKKNYYFPKIMAILSFINKFLPVSVFTFIMSRFASDPKKKPKTF